MYEAIIKDIRGADVLVPGCRVYSKEERARAVLLGGCSLDAFVLAFVWCGVPYYKKVN